MEISARVEGLQVTNPALSLVLTDPGHAAVASSDHGAVSLLVGDGTGIAAN